MRVVSRTAPPDERALSASVHVCFHLYGVVLIPTSEQRVTIALSRSMKVPVVRGE